MSSLNSSGMNMGACSGVFLPCFCFSFRCILILLLQKGQALELRLLQEDKVQYSSANMNLNSSNPTDPKTRRDPLIQRIFMGKTALLRQVCKLQVDALLSSAQVTYLATTIAAHRRSPVLVVALNSRRRVWISLATTMPINSSPLTPPNAQLRRLKDSTYMGDKLRP